MIMLAGNTKEVFHLALKSTLIHNGGEEIGLKRLKLEQQTLFPFWILSLVGIVRNLKGGSRKACSLSLG